MEIKELAEILMARLDKLDEKVEDARTTLAGQAADISHHIRRTDALEKRVEQVADDLKPVKEHVAKLKGAAGLIGLIATLAGIYHYVFAG